MADKCLHFTVDIPSNHTVLAVSGRGVVYYTNAKYSIGDFSDKTDTARGSFERRKAFGLESF